MKIKFMQFGLFEIAWNSLFHITYLLKKYFSKSSLLSLRLYNDAVDLLRASDDPENNESGASCGLLCCLSLRACVTWFVIGSRKIVIKLRTAPIQAWVWHLSEFSKTSSILLWSWDVHFRGFKYERRLTCIAKKTLSNWMDNSDRSVFSAKRTPTRV